MITYNHGPYILEALQGIVMQKGNFDLELIICNDCSTDDTHQVIENFLSTYPGTVQIDYRHLDSNIGISANFYNALSYCKGSYIAICEGDDYWTDAYKLQKQLDIAEAHPNISLVVHGTEILAPYKKIRGRTWKHIPDQTLSGHFFDIRCILSPIHRYPFHTSSFFIRRSKLILQDYLQLIENINFCDIQLAAYLSIKGEVYYIDETMSHYRIHRSGITQSNANRQAYINFKLDFIRNLQKLKSMCSEAQYHAIDDFIRSEYYMIAEMSKKDKDIAQCRKYFMKAFPSSILFDKLYLKSTIQMALYCLSPSIFNALIKDIK